MPAVTSATDEENKEEKISQQMSAALKKHIIRERQRKKEEHEAEVEEERLRKEREARERQDVMTLGETREQIQQLEQKLSQLKEEKHQLFLQLKKVLNEDDNRKKQQNKDTNEMCVNMNGMVPGGNMVQSQLFLPPTVSQGNPNMGRPPLSAHMLNKSGGGGMKRVRSPSPPYASPGATYLHHPHHKQPHAPHSQGPTHKIEDGRCREISRAVLWNKPSQYNTGGGGASFYAMPSQGDQRAPPLIYTGPVYQHVHHHTPPKQQSDYGRQPPPSVSGPTTPSSGRHNPQLMSGQVHPVGQMQHNNTQNAKPGSITSGYPVRQQNPSVQNPNIYPNRHRY